MTKQSEGQSYQLNYHVHYKDIYVIFVVTFDIVFMFYKWPTDFLNLQVGKNLQLSKAPGKGGVWNRILEKTNLSPQVWDFPSESTEGLSRARDTAVHIIRIYIPCLVYTCNAYQQVVPAILMYISYYQVKEQATWNSWS